MTGIKRPNVSFGTTTTAASGNGTTGDRSAEQAAHTPGPWAVYAGNDDEFRPGIDAMDGTEAVIIFGDGHDQCGITGRTKSEAQANARLIAAAPNMLAALQAVAADRFAMMLDPNTCDDVLAAIAKATGTAD